MAENREQIVQEIKAEFMKNWLSALGMSRNEN